MIFLCANLFKNEADDILVFSQLKKYNNGIKAADVVCVIQTFDRKHKP